MPDLYASDLMVNPVTIKEYADTNQACEIISEHTFHSLPIVNDNNNIVGIISTTDLLENIRSIKN